MGIPSYFSYIVRQHRAIIKQINTTNSPNINNLYLDCNSFIYEAFYNLAATANKSVALESDIIKQVGNSLIKVIQMLKPNKRVFIAFDGVAPLAKLNQQRNRRYMSAFQSSMNKSTEPAAAWNTSAITPGTAFMHELGLSIRKQFSKPQDFSLETIIVSPADEVGEGEHKIYEYIRREAEYHRDTCTVIYGLDADLIMLTLNHLHISENMYLFRETPEFIKSVDKTLNPHQTYLLDIPLFARTIIRELDPNILSTEIESISLKNDALFDYILLCFFLGNDFLPHFPALNIRNNGINKLIDAYKTVFIKTTMTKDRQIVWKNVRQFIDYLAANELGFIKDEYIHRDKIGRRAMYDIKEKNTNANANANDVDENLLLPLKDRSIEIYINPNEIGWEKRYYNALFNIRINDERRQEISVNYLEGLEWTMKYYSTGCVDWRWMYNYYYPPLLTDLIKHVPYFDRTFVLEKPKKPVSALVQLSYVLPPSSMNLLPPTLQTKLVKAQPDWYTGNYVFLWAFCKFFWEAHVELPHIDIPTLEKIVEG